MTKCVSRLAPSPTGALHLGNARTFLVNWALARNSGWELLLRIEDLDGPRVRPETTRLCLDLLAWLGIDYDRSPLHQSHDLEPYRTAMRHLAAAGRTYSCHLTRRQIEQAASAPHLGDRELRCPPSLRPTDIDRYRFEDEAMNYRLMVEPETIEVDDAIMGRIARDPAVEVGDFVIWTRRGTPAYQLAVVVDDIRQGVTDVVRGDDLLASAARQELLYRLLGQPTPRWWHLPLVVGPDGRRLAKRHGDTRLDSYRAAGVPAPRVIGLLACWCGLLDRPAEISAEDFRSGFSLATLPRTGVTFQPEDHAWLLRGC